jgi:hypothetical protein
MKVLAITLILFFSPYLSWTEEASLPKFAPLSLRTPDLDFANDIDWDPLPHSSSVQGREAAAYHPWLYWGLGITVVGGGVTFFILDQEKPTRTTKTVQKFTDTPN